MGKGVSSKKREQFLLFIEILTFVSVSLVQVFHDPDLILLLKSQENGCRVSFRSQLTLFKMHLIENSQKLRKGN